MFAAVLHPQHEAAFVMTGLVCLRIGLECAFLTAPLAWLLLRRGAILDVPLTSATVGAFAGLAGLVVLEIFCPNLNVHHVIVWHLGAALASTMGGLVVGYLAAHLATACRRF